MSSGGDTSSTAPSHSLVRRLGEALYHWTSFVFPSAYAAGFTWLLRQTGLPGMTSLFPSGWSERAVYTVGVIIVHMMMYWGMNGVFYMMDFFRVGEQYRIERRPGLKRPPEDLVEGTITKGLLAQLLLQPITAYLVYDVAASFGATGAVMPHPWEVFKQFLACCLINDTLFYWSHRWLHTPFLYKHVHKVHHSYASTIGFAAEHAHWFEQVVSNQGPTIIGSVLLGSNFFTWWLFLAYRLEKTYETHSGYAFKGAHPMQSRFHDFHHSNNRGAFGGNPAWDILCGTDVQFKQHARRKGWTGWPL